MSPCPEAPETFWTLLHDAAHWEFELFLMLVFDGVVGALAWPFVKKHWGHHVARDKKDGVDVAEAQKKSVHTAVYSCRACSRAYGNKTQFKLVDAFIRPVYGKPNKAVVCCPACHGFVRLGPHIVGGVIDLKKLGIHFMASE